MRDCASSHPPQSESRHSMGMPPERRVAPPSEKRVRVPMGDAHGGRWGTYSGGRVTA